MTEEKQTALTETELNSVESNSKKKHKTKKEKSKDKPILDEAQIKAKRARKNRLTVAAFVLLLGVGVMGN